MAIACLDVGLVASRTLRQSISIKSPIRSNLL